jgi:hypothetical protein
MKQGSSPEYRHLLQDLMLRGWYRAGAEPGTEGTPPVWHFRHGHCTDGQPGPVLSMQAPSELEAMQTVLKHLRSRDPAASGSTPASLGSGRISPFTARWMGEEQ